ncbi:MAG: N-6 DNA methylase [Chloroflexi bacterium]|nr:N-6 DNA methylase [Chloroflexota bacterium]
MFASKQEARQEIARLVAEYQALTPAQVKACHEAKTRQGFVEPLFRALGWDFDNIEEVSPEERASKGRVDYAFKIKGVSRFYLEAKHLNADLNNPDYVKQAVTYAYNKGVTWAGLTSFDRLRLFNARTGQPFLNLACDDYLPDFERLWLLSRESVETGALDREAEKVGALKPAEPLEKRLFAQLRQWREELFSQLHGYNGGLTIPGIDEIIQRLFNRLIFIRTCEDRGIEEKLLLAALNRWRGGEHKPELVERLREVFRRFDGYYDSDLFVRHPVDSVVIDAVSLSGILKGLYDVPGGVASYDFSVIEPDVLGAVYEQYLGYVPRVVRQKAKEAQARLDLGFATEEISLEAGRQKRKQQGIFYTPKWITDYVVKHTVGQFLAEQSHDQIVNIKILDPACGSGSFLIRAYDELLRYHASVKGKTVTDLDQWERLPVLTGNVFGVDLDRQAMEITRLNLLLRSLARRETLPSLADNIRRGNSLVAGGEAELRPYFGESWKEKQAFSWEKEFPAIISGGGFDVVVGNPPYVRIQSLGRDEADYYRDQYESAYGSFDIYVLFIEKGIALLKPGGRLGFICSGKFLKSQYGEKVLQLIRKDCTVERIVDLSAGTVFAEATTYPAIIIIKKSPIGGDLQYVSVPAAIANSDVASAAQIDELATVAAPQEALTRKVWPPVPADDGLWKKLAACSDPLGDVADRIFQGLITSADRVYILEQRGEAKEGMVRVYSRATEKTHELEAGLLKSLLSGPDIKRYGAPHAERLLLFPYRTIGAQATLVTAAEFRDNYPRTWRYLLRNRETLENREGGKMKHDRWYAYVYPKNLALHDHRKLAIPRLVEHLKAVYDGNGSFYLDNVDVGGIILKDGPETNYLYVLGLLHSRLLDYCFRRISAPFRGGFRSANRQFIEPLPIRRIDPTNPADVAMRDGLVSLVQTMLGVHAELDGIPPERVEDRQEVERKIRQTDAEIDGAVFRLYGLSQEEENTVRRFDGAGGPRD